MKVPRRDLIIGVGGLVGLGYLSILGAKIAKADFANLSLSVSNVSVSTSDGTVTSIDVDGSQTDAIQLEWQGLEATDNAEIELYANAPDQSTTSLTRESLVYNSNDIICHSGGTTFEICDLQGSVLDSITYSNPIGPLEKRDGYNEVYLLVHGDDLSAAGDISHIDVANSSELNRIGLGKDYSTEPNSLKTNSNYFYVQENKNVDIFNKSDGSLAKSFNNSNYASVNLDSNSLWLLRIESDDTLSLLEYSHDGSTKKSEYLSIMPKNSITAADGDMFTISESDYIYVGGTYVDKIDKSDGSQYWRMDDSGSNVDCSDIEPITNGSEIVIKSSDGYVYQVQRSDGSYTKSSSGGAPNGKSVTVDPNQNYIFVAAFSDGTSTAYYRVRRSDSSEKAVGLEGNVLASQYVKTTSTTTINEDLLVSNSLSLDSLSGSFSGTFKDIFGNNVINIPSNHADLTQSHFEESIDGATENTDITFRLRVVLQTAGVEDSDSDTATYSVTNS